MKEILEKIKNTREVANTEVRGDPKTRSGREMMRRQAQEELPVLLKEASDEFSKVGYPVLLSGDGVSQFIAAAHELHEVVLVDFHKATSVVRDAVSQTVTGRNKEFSPSAFASMLREIRNLGVDLGLTSIPDMSYDGPEQVSTPAEVDSVVDKYLIKYLGADFIAGILENSALGEVIVSSGEEAVVPVLISNLNPSMHRAVGAHLFGGKYIAAPTTEKTNTDEVVAVFKQIKANKNAVKSKAKN